jgi:hypothetical protein
MQGSSRIMIWNDDSDEIVRMRDAFKKAEWKADIQEIHSGRDAIIALRRNHFTTSPADLLMCSIRVNGESIPYFLGILRAHPNINRQPIVTFSTGEDDAYIISSCRTFGVMKYFSIADGEISFYEMLIEVRAHFSNSGRLISNGTWEHRKKKPSVDVLHVRNPVNIPHCT